MRLNGLRLGHLLLAVLFILPCGVEAQSAAPRIPDFALIHISDSHINPQPRSAADPSPTDRSVREIAWICEEVQHPQPLDPFKVSADSDEPLIAPKPSFVINTGDLTEYGVIHRTWENFERYFEPLNMPHYVVPGNHDNTWTGMMHIMREKYGGDHYSFQKFGCHFAGINTATPQEPVPSIEQRTLTWLAADLEKVPPDMPVFLFCHHPLSSGEFAKPYEQLRLLEVIRNHNVVLLMMGHGHGARHERWGRLDSVMGGATFNHNPQVTTTGYSVISVIDGVLRVAYRYKDPDTPMKRLLEKPIHARPGPSVELVDFPDMQVISTPSLPIQVRVRGRRPPENVSAMVNTDEKRKVELTPGPDGLYQGSLPLHELLPGAHFVHVTAEIHRLKLDRAASFLLAAPDQPVRESRIILPAGMKADPIVLNAASRRGAGGDHDLIVATTAGNLHRVRFSSDGGSQKSFFSTGAEILHPPALRDGIMYFSSGDKAVYAVDLDGGLKWRQPVSSVVYSTPAVDNGSVYVGDLEGFVHALDRRDGGVRWSKHHATFSIEQSLLLHEGVLYFGAWDGLVYAVDTRDGSLKWKQRSPAGQSRESRFQSRYYAAADCSPLIIGQRLFVTDRAYRLGSYDLDGNYLGEIAADISAIGLSEDGQSFYARGLNEGLTRYDAEGRRVWSSPVPLGRFPIPPTEVAGTVYVCSNLGTLTAHNAETGEIKWRYQVSPRLHVMAPVAADREGNAYVAAMDGSVTRIGPSVNGPGAEQRIVTE